MYSTLVSVALVAAAFVGSVSADLKIGTPKEMFQCKPIQLSWGKSTPPYDLIVAPASDPCNTVLADLGGNHTSTSLTWKPNLKAGTEVVFSLLDGTGEEGWTGSITISPSDDFSCLSAADQPPKAANTTTSSASTSSGPATTLVVPPNNAQNTPPANPAAPTDTAGAVPVGAANAGINPLSNGASGSHAFSGAGVAFSVVAAVVLAASL